jgi:phage shock protein PspC (stress-responsive transcriptional regulator)
MIAGVAGGIARKYGFDPALVRLAIVGITILSFGLGVVGYLVAWLLVPEADVDEPVLTSALQNARRHGPRRPFDKRFLLGLVLIVVGANALADRIGYPFDRFSRVFWPMLLIGGGAAVLLLRDRHASPLGPESEPPPATASSPEAPAPSSDPVTAPEFVSPPEPAVGEARDAGAAEGAVASPPGFPPTAYPPTLQWPQPPRPPMPPPRRRRRERSMLGRLTWSALLVVAGTAWLVDVTGIAGVDVRVVIAIELAVVGLALVVGAWFGRSRGLITLGLLLTLAAGTFSVLDVPLRGPIGERIVRPNAIGELDGRYRLAIGHLELDLGNTRLDGKAHRVVLTNAIGYVEVIVPPDARVEVIARADTGSLDLFNQREADGTHVRRVVYDDPPNASGPRLLIDAHVGFGAVKVSRSEGIPR